MAFTILGTRTQPTAATHPVVTPHQVPTPQPPPATPRFRVLGPRPVVSQPLPSQDVVGDGGGGGGASSQGDQSFNVAAQPGPNMGTLGSVGVSLGPATVGLGLTGVNLGVNTGNRAADFVGNTAIKGALGYAGVPTSWASMVPAIAGVMGPAGLTLGAFQGAAKLGELGLNYLGNMPTTAQSLAQLGRDPTGTLAADTAAAVNNSLTTGAQPSSRLAADVLATSALGNPMSENTQYANSNTPAGFGRGAPISGPQANMSLNPDFNSPRTYDNPQLNFAPRANADDPTADSGVSVGVGTSPGQGGLGFGPATSGDQAGSPGQGTTGPSSSGVSGPAGPGSSSDGTPGASDNGGETGPSGDSSGPSGDGGGGGGGGGGGCYLATWVLNTLPDSQARRGRAFFNKFYNMYMRENPDTGPHVFREYQNVARQIIGRAESNGPDEVKDVHKFIYRKLIQPTGAHLDKDELPKAVENMARVVTTLARHYDVPVKGQVNA